MYLGKMRGVGGNGIEGSETTREKTKCRAKLEVRIIDAKPDLDASE